MTNEPGDISLGEAATKYLSGLPAGERAGAQQEINRLVRWFGGERRFAGLAAYEVEQYAGQLSPLATDYLKKVDTAKAFLARAKKEGWTPTNLGASIKIKKGKNTARNSARRKAAVKTTMTSQGYAELKAELDDYKKRRLKVIEDIRRAAEDKDFRENAPLQAAREERGHIEGRIIELEELLKSAVVIEENRAKVNKVAVGSSVVLCEVDSGEEWCYVLVSPREVNVIEGKISDASPVGRAVIGRREGEVVEVNTPAGKMHCLVKQIS